MIPRNLPALTATAVRGGWDVSVEHHPDLHAVVTAKFGHGMTLIEMVWSDAHLDHSTINGTPTPYTQCTRLIRCAEPPQNGA